MIFEDREDAGRQLAKRLGAYAGRADVVVLGIPRGGVVVAWEVARVLDAPLDAFLAAKLSVPGQEELAFGAIAEDGGCYLDEKTIRAAQISAEEVAKIRDTAVQRLRERAGIYRAHRSPLAVENKTVILVDDGIATGASIQVSILALRARLPVRLVVAVPVAPASTCARLRTLVDELVCVTEPWHFGAVSQFYVHFPQADDAALPPLLWREGPDVP
jgi:putative phosphoribosyl transferase